MKILPLVAFLAVWLGAIPSYGGPPLSPAQVTSALMRQSEGFHVIEGQSEDLASARCRGTRRASGRFVAFTCTGTVAVGFEKLAVRIAARTRRAGGVCWAVAPAAIPSGCLAPGKRGEGSSDDAFRAAVRVVGNTNQNFRCIPHGSGFFSCTWEDASGLHRGTVTFKPAPAVRVIS